MNIIECDIPGPLVIEPKVYGDDRGFFLESWNADSFKERGLNFDFVQDNHSRSNYGVLRGLHFQNPNPQGKLVRVISGRVWDVAVDLRRSSATYGRWTGVELSARNKRMFWVPEGFAHGFVTLEDGTDFLYKCTAQYCPENEQALLWNDPEVGIEWPIDSACIRLSEKDQAAASFSSIEAFV